MKLDYRMLLIIFLMFIFCSSLEKTNIRNRYRNRFMKNILNNNTNTHLNTSSIKDKEKLNNKVGIIKIRK